MATPAFKAAGSAVYTANSVVSPTTLSPSSPTRAAGDLLVYVTCSIGPSATCTTPTGYNAVNGFPVQSGTGSGGKIYVFVRTATNTAADDASTVWTLPVTGTSGTSASARILSYSNALPYIDGIATKTDTAATTSWTMPATTTTIANSLVVGVSVKVSDTNQTTTISTFTERSDDATQTGTGHITEVSDIVVASPGSSGTGTVTPSDTTSSRVLAISFGLLATQPALITSTTTAVNDTFTDADGTALTSHTGETGATWTSHGSYTTGAKINTNRAEAESVSGLHYASGVPGAADYIVQGVVRKVTNVSSSASGFALRVNTGADTYYAVVWGDVLGSSFFVVTKTVAGATSTLAGAAVSDNAANGTDRTVRAEISGSLLSLYTDGTLIWQGGDTAIASTGRVGVKTNLGSSTTGYHVSDITASTRSALTATSTASTTLALNAPTLPALTAASATATTSLSLTAPTAVPLTASSATASTTLALAAQTTVSLGQSSATASTTLALRAPTTVPLGAATATASTSLSLTVGASQVPLQPASGLSSTTLALTATTQLPLETAVAAVTAILSLSGATQVVLTAASGVTTATLVVTIPAPPVPEWEQHTDSEWPVDTDTNWNQDEGDEWMQSSDDEWIMA